MSRRSPALKICLNGRLVGKYSRLSHGGTEFRYAVEWLSWPNAIPISQSMPFRERPYTGDIVTSYFENLLPDSEPILRKIAEKTGAQGRDAHSILYQIGRDCVGALQFLPDDAEILPLALPIGRKLNYHDISHILKNLERNPLGADEDGGFRISIAGAQEKAAFLKIDQDWYEPKGMSPTTHIFKPAIGEVPWESGPVDMSQSVENEHYCLSVLGAFGLEVASTEIAEYDSGKVLIVERFDRQKFEDGIIVRLPQEDMCQALGHPPSQKYQNQGGPTLKSILEFLNSSETPQKDQMTVFKCQVLFWLMGAIDGHAKNFSIFLTPNDGFRLTPIYDVMSGQTAFDAKQVRHKDYRLAMSVGKNNKYRIDNIHGRHFLETAVAAGLSEDFAREAICHVQDEFKAAFEAAIASMPDGFPHRIHDSIYEAAKKRLPGLESAFQ